MAIVVNLDVQLAKRKMKLNAEADVTRLIVQPNAFVSAI